ncbi:MAG TPA: hypothetical protein VJ420_06145 [Candidatus Udaeobacter sp.]|nr:hypothetical protein [Candidatus Udaeobacter sp.]
MALSDDLNKLAAQDVVYLTRSISGIHGGGPTEVFRGRLRQALNGNWVFTTSQNGVVGFLLGNVVQNSWNSVESPATGVQITIIFQLGYFLGANAQIDEVIVLTSVIPTDFAD